MIFKSPIAIGLSPNAENDDVWQALKTMFAPWSWKKGADLNRVEEWFKRYFSVQEISLFNSGRSALLAVLKTFGIGRGDEVLMQAFTCVAVPDAVIWNGAKPVFIDVDETLNIDPDLLEQRINTRTKAIIVQHTFGIGAKIGLIKKIAHKYNLILIEDCAHALGATLDGQLLGTFGDAAIFSFGRDKVISSVFGGMAIINSKFKIQNSKLEDFQRKLSYPSYFWIFQQLLHPIAFSFILPLYDIFVGKLLLFKLQMLRLLSKPIYKGETIGEKPNVFPKRFPNALASLLLTQLNKLDKYNQKRLQVFKYYCRKLLAKKDIRLPPNVDGSVYLRFNVLTSRAEELFIKARKHKIILGNWYRNTIDPSGVDYDKIGYKVGSCLKAEEAARLSVNLPTYPKLTEGDLEKVIKLFE